jgi:hypothetical protein
MRSVREDLLAYSGRVNSAAMGRLMVRLCEVEFPAWVPKEVDEKDAFAIRLAGLVRFLFLKKKLSSMANLAEFCSILQTDVHFCDRFLASFPQTNEVTRSSALFFGLSQIVFPRCCSVRLLELGAAAGLNLNVDRYGFSCWLTSMTSSVCIPLKFEGRLLHDPPRLPLISFRRGCDLRPVRDGSILCAFVFDDEPERNELLRSALALPDCPAVDEGDAVDWLAASLQLSSEEFTVVWSSMTLQYMPKQHEQKLTELVRKHDRVIWLRLEHPAALGIKPTDGPYILQAVRREDEHPVVLATYDGQTLRSLL